MTFDCLTKNYIICILNHLEKKSSEWWNDDIFTQSGKGVTFLHYDFWLFDGKCYIIKYNSFGIIFGTSSILLQFIHRMSIFYIQLLLCYNYNNTVCLSVLFFFFFVWTFSSILDKNFALADRFPCYCMSKK